MVTQGNSVVLRDVHVRIDQILIYILESSLNRLASCGDTLLYISVMHFGKWANLSRLLFDISSIRRIIKIV